MMDWADSGWLWWWMLPMMLFMVALVGTVIWALAMTTRSDRTTGEARRPTAEDILEQRFVRGEIDTAEYHDRLDALRDHPVCRPKIVTAGSDEEAPITAAPSRPGVGA